MTTQDKMLRINWRIRKPVSVSKDKTLLVYGKDEQNKDISIVIEDYQEIIDWLQKEKEYYKLLFDCVSGPKTHFKNCVDVYGRRIAVLESYLKN